MRSTNCLALLALAACTVHPDGEQDERDAADRFAVLASPWAERQRPVLGSDAVLADLQLHAERSNGDVEAGYHAWRIALAAVTEAGTQPTTAMLGVEHTLDGGDALDRTALTLMTDSMENLLMPGRLESQAAAALARARVAGGAFLRARLELQQRVAAAYHALAARDEELRSIGRLDQALALQLAGLRAEVAAGRSAQAQLLAGETAALRLQAELAALRTERPRLLAELRAVIGAGPEFTELHAVLPPLRPLPADDRDLIGQVLRRDPLLHERRLGVAAARAEVAAREWQHVPSFSLRGMLMGDGAGLIGGAFTLPFLRGAAIDASIAAAEYEVAAAEAMRRQRGNDAIAALLGEQAALASFEVQSRILAGDLQPRLQQLEGVTRAAWSAGRGAIADWVMAVDAGVSVERTLLRLRQEHADARARLSLLLAEDALQPRNMK